LGFEIQGSIKNIFPPRDVYWKAAWPSHLSFGSMASVVAASETVSRMAA